VAKGEAGVKHLYVNADGKIYFNINGFGTLYGRTSIRDGEEHQIALRHIVPELKWILYIDGKEDGHKVIP